jgi:hypothetical protein
MAAVAALNRALVSHIHIEVSAGSGAATIKARKSSSSRPELHLPLPLRVNAYTRKALAAAMIDIAIVVYFIVFVASKGW